MILKDFSNVELKNILHLNRHIVLANLGLIEDHILAAKHTKTAIDPNYLVLGV